jgi:hypothetical protein
MEHPAGRQRSPLTDVLHQLHPYRTTELARRLHSLRVADHIINYPLEKRRLTQPQGGSVADLTSPDASELRRSVRLMRVSYEGSRPKSELAHNPTLIHRIELQLPKEWAGGSLVTELISLVTYG